jgi:hypothetical protein
VLLVCTIQLGVHTRLEPYKTRGENLLQYASSIMSFALAFGGLLVAYIELNDQEQSLRLFGTEWDTAHRNNVAHIEMVRNLMDTAMVMMVCVAVAYGAHVAWLARHKVEAKARVLLAKLRCVAVDNEHGQEGGVVSVGGSNGGRSSSNGDVGRGGGGGGGGGGIEMCGETKWNDNPMSVARLSASHTRGSALFGNRGVDPNGADVGVGSLRSKAEDPEEVDRLQSVHIEL